MKIIDLLNKIANGEEVPKKIKYAGIIWEYDNTTKDYISDDMFLIYKMNSFALNKSFEILEEEKKIPEKLEDFDLTTYSRDDEDLGLELHYTGVSNTFNDVYLKINSIIDYLKSKGDE